MLYRYFCCYKFYSFVKKKFTASWCLLYTLQSSNMCWWSTLDVLIVVGQGVKGGGGWGGVGWGGVGGVESIACNSRST